MIVAASRCSWPASAYCAYGLARRRSRWPALRRSEAPRRRPPLDTSGRAEFVSYYAEGNVSEYSLGRFRRIQALILRYIDPKRLPGGLDVADIGCNAGEQCFMWAALGHRVHGVDISEPLIDLARARAAERGLSVEFTVGTATRMPWTDASMDVCIMPQLLEHVPDWQTCLDEAARVLRPGGILYLSTTNKLCPLQDEYRLPLYSWYPGFLKRRYERLARTTRPEIANYATYPAVNWFTPFGLRAAVERRGFKGLDRFDTVQTQGSKSKTALIGAIRAFPPLRFGAHFLSTYSRVLAIRR